MPLFYLVTAIVGAVLLVASFFGAHDHDVGGGHDSAGHDTGNPALQLLSVRFWTYVLAFGGATGLLLHVVAHAGEPLAAVLAGATGIVAGAAARALIARAGRTVDSGTVLEKDLVGKTGGVMIPFTRGATGKVRVRVQNRDVDLLATTDDGSTLGRDEEVLIVEMREGSAVVTRSPGGREPARS